MPFRATVRIEMQEDTSRHLRVSAEVKADALLQLAKDEGTKVMSLVCFSRPSSAQVPNG